MPVLNTIFTTTIYKKKKKIQVSFFKCHVLVTKGFSTDIYIQSYVLCKKSSLHITDDSCFVFRSSICLDCIFINGCAGNVCV